MSQQINKKKRPTTSKKPKRRSKSVANNLDQGSVINLDPNQWLLPETKEFLQGPDHKSDTENESPIEAKPIDTKKLPTPYDEVKSYLKKNSLIVRGLTIFDVLYPTSVTIKDPRHVQVIHRDVLAKIWDDILPLAYGSFVGKLRLVNHYAVDLKKYEDNLRELIENYYQFTSHFIWKHLSDEDKHKLAPSLHWNRLSKDEQNSINQEITKEEHTDQSTLENFAWRKLDQREQNELLEKPAVYQDTNQILLKKTLKDTESEFALKGVARMDVEIHRAIKFLKISTDLRQLQKRADAESKSNVEPKSNVESKPKPKRKSSVERSIGQRVICRFDDDGFFYPGTIQKNHSGRSIIHFDMGIDQEAIGHILLPTNGAIAQPNLFVKDCVFVRQMNEHREYWAPGIVIILPSLVSRPPLYSVQIYTPSSHQVHVPRRDLLKISLGLFQRTLLYLQNIDHPPIPDTSVDDEPPTSGFENTLRKELEPLTTQVEHLHKSHNRRYNQLKTALEDQMAAIKHLQGRTSKTTSKTTASGELSQPIEISVGRVNTPRPRTPTPTRAPTSPPPISPIEPSEDLSRLKTKVYTVWFDDDSLAYEGTVLEKNVDTNAYTVERDDLPSNSSTISRDDIYLRTECQPIKALKSKSFALIEYPKDSRHCWSPAAILQHNSDKAEVHVRFYDGIDQYLPHDEDAIAISEGKFREYATRRIEFERSLSGQAIVGLNDETQTYLLGTIIDRTKSSHEYLIGWCDNNRNKQTEEHLFGALIRRNRHQINHRVLALDNEQYIYKFAEVINHSNDWKELTVRFTNPDEPNRERTVLADTTFLITDGYYRSVVKEMRQ